MRLLKHLVLMTVAVVALPVGVDGKATGPIYLARRIPEGTEIKVDGDLSDWQWLAPVFSTSDEFPFARWDVPEEDFGVEVKVAWSPETNMLYHAVKVTDDKLLTLPREQAQKMWRYDLLELFIDADGSGGNYRGENNSAQAQQYFLYLPPDRSACFGLFGPQEKLGWSLKAPYAKYAAKYDGKTICYELAQNVWDFLGESPQQSRLHNLKAGQVMGWKITVKDRDNEKEAPIGCTLRPSDAWENADNFARLMLTP